MPLFQFREGIVALCGVLELIDGFIKKTQAGKFLGDFLFFLIVFHYLNFL
jgi:hypothetical protein